MKSELEDAKSTARAVNVHPQLLRELARKGMIPSYRLSPRTLRFDVSEVRKRMRELAKKENAA
jgi:hypothetical protein